ncbi:MAG TPA: CpsB/CapC family capsule biosynthesis tyrosine phosphatase [Gaiella sp.]|nr:CpsB/CapC family capsule biosynthesis tyrosine phosphatase [Gaiella sp.]
MPPAGFVDVHSHVVPSGDDGAASVEEGIELCRVAYETGTRVLFATPHAHARWDTYPRTAQRDTLYEASFPRVRDAVAGWGLDLRRGWEVYPSVLVDGEAPDSYALEGTNAVLLEFPGWWVDVADAVELVAQGAERVAAAGFVPLLAHPERCSEVMAEPESVRPLAEAGWPLCLNGPSLTGDHGGREEHLAWRLLEDGLISLVASDAHNRRRPPTLDRSYAAVEARYGQQAALPLFDGSAIPWADVSAEVAR